MEPMGKLPTILTSLIVATILGFRAGLGISGVFYFFAGRLWHTRAQSMAEWRVTRCGLIKGLAFRVSKG